MVIKIKNGEVAFGLRITLGYAEWETDYKHSIFVITHTKEDAENLAQELANAYDNWESNNVDAEVMKEFENSIYQYILNVLEITKIENAYVSFDDVILE